MPEAVPGVKGFLCGVRDARSQTRRNLGGLLFWMCPEPVFEPVPNGNTCESLRRGAGLEGARLVPLNRSGKVAGLRSAPGSVESRFLTQAAWLFVLIVFISNSIGVSMPTGVTPSPWTRTRVRTSMSGETKRNTKSATPSVRSSPDRLLHRGLTRTGTRCHLAPNRGRTSRDGAGFGSHVRGDDREIPPSVGVLTSGLEAQAESASRPPPCNQLRVLLILSSRIRRS